MGFHKEVCWDLFSSYSTLMILGPCIPQLEVNPKIVADDTNIFVCSPTLTGLKTKCQRVVDILSDWMLANRLTVNCKKTNYILLSPTKCMKDSFDLDLKINNILIKKIAVTKYLGVYIQ